MSGLLLYSHAFQSGCRCMYVPVQPLPVVWAMATWPRKHKGHYQSQSQSEVPSTPSEDRCPGPQRDLDANAVVHAKSMLPRSLYRDLRDCSDFNGLMRAPLSIVTRWRVLWARCGIDPLKYIVPRFGIGSPLRTERKRTKPQRLGTPLPSR